MSVHSWSPGWPICIFGWNSLGGVHRVEMEKHVGEEEDEEGEDDDLEVEKLICEEEPTVLLLKAGLC